MRCQHYTILIRMKKLSLSYRPSPRSQQHEQEDEQEDKSASTTSTCASSASTLSREGFSLCQIVGNFGRAFIVCCHEGRIYLVDQHAASEKSLFVKFLGERTLLPQSCQGEPFPVENIYIEVLQSQQEALGQLGWHYQVMERGPVFTQVRLTCSPSIFARQCQEHQFLETLAACYHSAQPQSPTPGQKQWMASFACHNAYKVGDTLTRTDMRMLVDCLADLQGCFNCPHGRPVVVGLGEADQYLQGCPREYPLQ